MCPSLSGLSLFERRATFMWPLLEAWHLHCMRLSAATSLSSGMHARTRARTHAPAVYAKGVAAFLDQNSSTIVPMNHAAVQPPLGRSSSDANPGLPTAADPFAEAQ